MKISIVSIVCLVFLLGCSNSNKDKTIVDESTFNISDNDDNENQSTNDEVVFYNVFSPVDLENMINEKNSYFNSSLLNSTDNLTSYTESSKIALNIGVYGADLSYLWVFAQTQQALSYLATIQHLSNKLGIPRDYVDFTSESIENNMQNMDSIASVARNAYNAAANYLNGSERKNASILILLGGWIETLYISTQMYTKPDPILASKIATQKYSLNSIITQMQNHQNDLVMSEYLILLRKLNETFAIFESQLKPGDIEIDTANKRITIKENSSLDIKPAQLNEINELVGKIRKHIIN
ncbi:MAG: hypothetical protein JEZ09_05170 [Salinivirgaceae bacterium]|nr:hypothetical protein [Salinivirgaceae bacterium]